MNIPAKPGSSSVEIHGNFVDGREIEAGQGPMLDVRNPATGEVIAQIPNSTAEDIDRAMKSARAAFEGKAWGGMDIRARARLVNKLADAFEANLDQLYKLETLNNGRPVNETRAQLSRLPDFFRYFAGVALARRDAVIPVEGSYLNYTLRTPIGIVANCTPFNHPLMILCKSLAAVLASGCVTVVKPSEYTPLTTLKLAKIFTDAGLPPGVFNIVLGLGHSAGKMLAFNVAELPEMPRGKGNKLYDIATKKAAAREEVLTGMAVVPPQGQLILHAGERRKVLEWNELKEYRGARAQRGAVLTRGWRQIDRLESVTRLPAE